jgi:low affinity Fe/Cu permease
MNELFRKFAHGVSNIVGTSWVFILAVLIILVWAITGPMFNYSDTWQLVINTGTTIITFLMVFLIQNTQNRDAKAIHLKLDELLRGVKGARTGLVNLESLSDEELDRLQKEFERLHGQHVEKFGAEAESRQSQRLDQGAVRSNEQIDVKARRHKHLHDSHRKTA